MAATIVLRLTVLLGFADGANDVSKGIATLVGSGVTDQRRASTLALPVSTTHVSSGAVVGVGLHRRDVRWRTLRDIAPAWPVTRPVAGLVAAGVHGSLGRGGLW